MVKVSREDRSGLQTTVSLLALKAMQKETGGEDGKII